MLWYPLPLSVLVIDPSKNLTLPTSYEGNLKGKNSHQSFLCFGGGGPTQLF